MEYDETLRNRRMRLIETHMRIAEALHDKICSEADRLPPNIAKNVHLPTEDYLLLLELALVGHATYEASNGSQH